ncbi:Crp/Fnr family transcriptional regulator [Microvirga guangxiensis]|uniref:cAMP-binding domain of CRP or a regulatory subunit of cAMP-dependent protein kinases n=1 Tax=Microvirga guangxiensis TaxID=549386 RepID=A0A1G5AS57_9HYPH|nr:Crp/Fnr family transcriptional regulator [Microvirga guangxiensis]SCX80640.1 cAMP-binding domain of CRP or a regulatory subunit of cAMP-dependent protein kinases [Microvirga guangxiensis]
MADLIGNYLIATLSPTDQEWLESNLKEVELQRGAILAHEGEVLQHVYFPVTAIVSLVCEMKDGRIAEMATFGREAILGLPFAGIHTETFGRYVVQVPGTMLQMDRRKFHAALTSRPGLQEMASRYTEILMVMTLQSVACNTAHSVESRCCRWIVSTADRTGRTEIPLTHEFLAEMLGVQRSTVSETTRVLQHKGLIAQGRGTITILDRARLEDTACECYGALRERYLRLLPLRNSNR